MFEDLIKYEDLLEYEPELFGFQGVTFLRDFGPWKKDEVVEYLWFVCTDNKATVEEQSSEGEVRRSCKFQLTAISA